MRRSPVAHIGTDGEPLHGICGGFLFSVRVMLIQRIGDSCQPPLVLSFRQDIFRAEKFLLISFRRAKHLQFSFRAQVADIGPADPQESRGLSHTHSGGNRIHLRETVFRYFDEESHFLSPFLVGIFRGVGSGAKFSIRVPFFDFFMTFFCFPANATGTRMTLRDSQVPPTSRALAHSRTLSPCYGLRAGTMAEFPCRLFKPIQQVFRSPAARDSRLSPFSPVAPRHYCKSRETLYRPPKGNGQQSAPFILLLRRLQSGFRPLAGKR